MQQGLLPLFPLEVVLMPGGHLPLHIFEARYKEMIGEALRDHTEFGVVLVRGGALVDTGCTAIVEGVLREYPDGRLDILTRGRRRFEILLVNEERNFLRGAVEFFEDDVDPGKASPDAREIATDAYNALQAVWKNPPLEEAAASDPLVSFRLVRAIRDLAVRQAILHSRSEAERIQKLAESLPGLAHKAQMELLMRETSGTRADPSRPN
jgi:Lon protease-like protein